MRKQQIHDVSLAQWEPPPGPNGGGHAYDLKSKKKILLLVTLENETIFKFLKGDGKNNDGFVSLPRLPGVLKPGPDPAVYAAAGNQCQALNAVKKKFQLCKWPLNVTRKGKAEQEKNFVQNCPLLHGSHNERLLCLVLTHWKNWPELKKYYGLSDSWEFGGKGEGNSEKGIQNMYF